MTKTTGSNPSKAEKKASKAKGKFYRPLYILAFDPGTEVTGYAFFPAGAEDLVDGENLFYGTIKPPEGAHIEVRCREIYKAVRHEAASAIAEWRALRDLHYVPVLVMEQARRSRFQAVYAALRCAQMAILCGTQSVHPEIAIRYVSPIQIRKALDLDAAAGKEDLRSRVGEVVKWRDRGDQRLYRKDLADVPQDAIDAIAIGLALSRGYMVENKKIGRLY